MPESIKARMSALSDRITDRETRKLFEAILVDLTAIRTSVTTLTAKLDADAGVTDTNYATLCNPASLTTTS